MIDTHCHITSASFADQDKIIQEALDAGVKRMVSIGVSLKDSLSVQRLVEKYACLYGACGVHPLDVAEEGVPTKQDLMDLVNHPKIVGVGETGLDLYHGTQESLPNQEESFLRHIEVAHALKKVVVIHARDAFRPTEDLLSYAIKQYPGSRLLMHCFTGDADTAHKFIEKFQCYISFSGIVTFGKKAEEIAEAARTIPLEYLVCETDAPYLAPHPYRGKLNTPAKVAYVYEHIARQRDMLLEDFIDSVQCNVKMLFGWSE
ncbi:MAG: TatD family hydrolase [Alphaproteobacteria bacterium]|nr:TatD family hydrolase [Alphaproteobacteria bacterium]